MTSDTAHLNLAVRSAEEIPGLYKSRLYWEQHFRKHNLWPAMLAYDSVYQKYSDEIDRQFAEFQLVAVLESSPRRVVGVAHSVPLRLTEHVAELPQTGWDFALEAAVANRRGGVRPNSVCGISITVLQDFQRCGVGSKLIEGILSLANRHKIQRVVMPVRPISKEDWPLMPMKQFLAWRREDGLHQDPWIRAHQRAGGKVLKTCHRSMTVTAPVSRWERWAGRTFSKPGEYVVKGCLVPVIIDTAQDTGLYREPNVWMGHTSS